MEKIDVLMIKLGGSLITDKSSPFTSRDRTIARLSKELSQSISAAELRGLRVIIAHGSGSFGHVAAAQGFFKKDGSASSRGVSDTQGAAHELHSRLIRALRAAGVAAFSVVPSSLFMGEKGKAVMLSDEPITHALRLGLTPVLFGDVVMDRINGACILSTERVCIGIARSLGRIRIKEALWLGTTDGVLDARGQCVAVLDRGILAELGNVVGASADVDVTGGMRHRVESVLELAELGVKSVIANGDKERLLSRYLWGKEVICTLVLPEDD